MIEEIDVTDESTEQKTDTAETETARHCCWRNFCHR